MTANDNRPEEFKMELGYVRHIFERCQQAHAFLQSAEWVKSVKQTHMLTSIKYDGLGSSLSLQSERIAISPSQWSPIWLRRAEAAVPVATALMLTPSKLAAISSCQFYRFKIFKFLSISLLQPHQH